MRQESRPRIPRELCHLRADLLEDLAFGAKMCWVHFPRLDVGGGVYHMTSRAHMIRTRATISNDLPLLKSYEIPCYICQQRLLT
jgi:hypothetical protein